jgi:hypothetical protein
VLEAVADTPASTMVIVDSFGYLYREQVDRLYRKYSAALEGTGKEIGIHAHNNLQLAFANTIEAIILGCNRVDAPSTASAAAPATATPSCCSASCATRSSTCARSSR